MGGPGGRPTNSRPSIPPDIVCTSESRCGQAWCSCIISGQISLTYDKESCRRVGQAFDCDELESEDGFTEKRTFGGNEE